MTTFRYLYITVHGYIHNLRDTFITIVTVLLFVLSTTILTTLVLVQDYVTACYAVMYGTKYTNQDYLYSIIIPEGLDVIYSPPPSPNHGFRVNLSSSHDDYIVVDGSYNSADYLSPSDYINRSYILPIAKNGVGITYIRSRSSVLGGLPAQRTSFKYNPAGDNKWVVMDVIAAFRKPAHDTEMIYTIALTSSPATCGRNRKVFEMMLSSWICDH